MPRYRVMADIKTDEVMSNADLHRVANTVGTLANTAAMHEIDGVEADLRVEKVVYIHKHESTDATACRDCRAVAGDGWNSDN